MGITLTLRAWLILQAWNHTRSPVVAISAVEQVAHVHPHWDMTERRTWMEWELTSPGGFVGG